MAVKTLPRWVRSLDEPAITGMYVAYAEVVRWVRGRTASRPYAPAAGHVLMNLALADGRRVDAWVAEDDVARLWHA